MSKKNRARARHQAAQAPQPAEDRRAGLRDLSPRQDLAAAGEREGSPLIPIIALVATTAFMLWYYHLNAMPQLSFYAAGQTMLDNRILGYSAADAAALGAAMDETARGMLNFTHKTAGVIFPILVALTFTAVSAWRLRPAPVKWGVFGVGVAFVALDVWENIAIESAIAGTGPVGLASALTVTRWTLFFLISAITLGLLLFGGRAQRRA